MNTSPYTAEWGVLESPEEVLTTLTREGKRKWIYPAPSKGHYYRRRLVTAWTLMVVFFLLPIVKIGGRPAILLDLMTRRFTFFGVTFYPTDTFLLLLLMVGVLLSVVLFTALLGRVWCGWACPQTVYLEFLYRPIEVWIEGPEHRRKRRDEGSLTLDKAWRKTAKYSVYAAFSLVLAHTFVAYFVGWDRLLVWLSGSPFSHWGYFVLMAITTSLVLYNFGSFREQMCTIACPYARLQSVLLDPDSLIVSYDPNRGEPRAKRSKKKISEEALGLAPALGDCIDCFACVRTCPVGIDIRDGLQMECIACTQCIDACDAIMDGIEKPRGLIGYTSEQALAGIPTRRLRTRTVLYGTLFVVVAGIFTIALATRSEFDVHVVRAVGEPYTVLPDGRIANRLRLSVRNQTPEATTFVIEGEQGVEIKIIGVAPIALDSQEISHVEAWVVLPAERLASGRADGRFLLRFEDGQTYEVEFPLLGPSP
ncbi:MAG: cytochrome c oxidase accessory protein CcoG [Rhodothermales bacterium]